MATTKGDILNWLQDGHERGATHMIVVCDTFDHDDYPVYVMPDEDVHKKESEYSGKNMQRVMEVYKLSGDLKNQLDTPRNFRY
jgi:hypothetical protein